MFRRIMALGIRGDADELEVAKLRQSLVTAADHIPSLLASWCGEADARPGGRTLVWDTYFDGNEGFEEYRVHPYHVDVIIGNIGLSKNGPVGKMNSVLITPEKTEIQQTGIANFLKRALFLELSPEASGKQIRELEHRLTEMPRYIYGIRNWAISRNPTCNESPKSAEGPRRWTHVWEQEFESAEGFSEYMNSPFHWGWVDQLFDPEGPDNICVSHLQLIYPLETSVLGWKP